MRSGERQVAPDLSGIRRDHLARYEWAAKVIGSGKYKLVLDAACGVGYGSYILAQAGCRVHAIDRSEDAIKYAKTHYGHPAIRYRVADCNDLGAIRRDFDERPQQYDAAVCFETIEHLETPSRLLESLRAAPLLLASVPNQEVFPHRGVKFHFRHYTKVQFRDLLKASGFEIKEWFGQEGAHSDVEPSVNGRTLVVKAKRVPLAKVAETRYQKEVDPSRKALAEMRREKEKVISAVKEKLAQGGKVRRDEIVDEDGWYTGLKRKPPERVAIVGLGPSLDTYTGLTRRLGSRARLCDEVWAINALGDVLQCDRVFHMDDVRVQEIRAAADPSGNIAAMLPWLRRHPGPIYTSIPHPDYPGMIAFPLADVLNSCGGERYFNSTAAYAVAYAIHIGVKEIQFYGCDFTYPNAHHAEAGRACLEFWMGIARARGILVKVARDSSLLDACVPPERRLYGYDAVKVTISGDPGKEVVTFENRDLPTAEEIEERYDHSRHPSPLLAERQ